MGWVLSDFSQVGVWEGTADAHKKLATEWPHLGLLKPTDMPVGSVYYKVKDIRFRCGVCALFVTVIDENGNGTYGANVFEGFGDGGNPLPLGTPPKGGMPDNKPLRGLVFPTGPGGIVTFGWGGGEAFWPGTEWGPHMLGVSEQQAEGPVYTEVVAGEGYANGTAHCTWDIAFQRTVVGEEPPPPPPPPDNGGCLPAWLRKLLVGS